MPDALIRTPVAGTDGTLAVERLALPDGQVRYRLFAPLIDWPLTESHGFLSADRCHAAARRLWAALPAQSRAALRESAVAVGRVGRAFDPAAKAGVRTALMEFCGSADTADVPTDRDWDGLQRQWRAAPHTTPESPEAAP